ncbi:hypothetical protein TSUD_75240 [Trifolium subterraneum]|nr:hypothetical protein TSUD_75240 [Trifolium subterraneum]
MQRQLPCIKIQEHSYFAGIPVQELCLSKLLICEKLEKRSHKKYNIAPASMFQFKLKVGPHIILSLVKQRITLLENFYFVTLLLLWPLRECLHKLRANATSPATPAKICHRERRKKSD